MSTTFPVAVESRSASNAVRAASRKRTPGTGCGTLDAVFAAWDRFERPISLTELNTRLSDLRLAKRAIARHALFDDHCYRRNLIHSGPMYDALVLCWRSGQRSPIHDHRGSACAVRVIAGTASETVFERSASGLIFPTRTIHAGPGSVSVSFDADIHQMGNLQAAGRDLITLHVYSPPLRFMQLYFIGDAALGERGDTLATALRARRVRGRSEAVQESLAAIRRRARTGPAAAGRQAK